MTWKSTSAKLLNDGDVFKVHQEKVHTSIFPERYIVATRWDLQDRDAVSDDEKRWVTGAYGNMGGRIVDGFLLARFEVSSFWKSM